MGTDREVTLTLKTIADVKQAASQLQQLKNIINNLKPGDELTRKFNEIFTKAQGYAEKATEAIDSKFKKNSDIQNFSNAVAGLNKQYTALANTMELINKEQLINLLGPEQLAQFEELKKTLTETEKALQNFKYAGDFETKFNNLKLTISEVTKGFSQFRTAIENNNLDKARDIVRNLTDEYIRLKNQKNEAEKDNNISFTDKQKTKYEELGRTLKVLNGILGYVSSKFNSLEQDNIQASNAMRDFITQALEPLQQDFKGIVGVVNQSNNAIRQSADEMANAAKASVQMGTELDRFKNRIAYFFGLNNAVRLLQRAFRAAYSTVKELDQALTETAVVTQYTVQDMWGKIPEYTEQANKLGVTIQDVAQASTLYYQQGLKTNEVTALTTSTLKMARIAGLEASDATDRMTNALRGFNMEINETSAERIADVYSKLAAMSASNVDEISTAMTKVASLAHNANMDFETTSAFLAQIIETTRESAETAGTALKTVVARFSEVKQLFTEGELLGTDEEGEAIDVNKVSKALRTAGIDLNEYLTGMKGLDDIFMELAQKWDSLDKVQQRYIATMAAGSRQQSRFIAMMQDYKRTTELVTAAQNAQGASQEQYEKTLDSLKSKLSKLQNSWNEFITGILNQSIIKFIVDALRSLLDIINKITSGLPGFTNGLSKALLALSGFKIVRTIIKNMFAGTTIGAMFMKQGTLAGLGFISGLEKTVKGFKGINWSQTLFGTGINQYKIALSEIQTATEAYKLSQLKIAGVVDAVTASELAAVDALNAHGFAMEKATAISQLNLTQEQLALVLSDEEIASQITKIALDETETLEEKKLAAAKLLEGKAASAGLITRLAENAARLLSIVGIHTETTAIGKWIAAKLAATAALKGFTAAQLLALPTLALLGGAIFGVIKFIQYLQNTTPEKKFEKLKEEAQKSAEAAKEATDNYNNLINSLDSLKDTQKNLQNLTKGTEAWKEAVKESNQQVLNLIDSYGELSKYVYYDEDGILRIKAEGYTKATEKSKKEAVDDANKAYEDQKKVIATENVHLIEEKKEEAYSESGEWDTVQKFVYDNLFLDAMNAFYKGATSIDVRDYLPDKEDIDTAAAESLYETEFEISDEIIAKIQTAVNDVINDYQNANTSTSAQTLNQLVMSEYVGNQKLYSALGNYLNKKGTGTYEEREELGKEFSVAFNNLSRENKDILTKVLSDNVTDENVNLAQDLLEGLPESLKALGLEDIIKNAIENAKTINEIKQIITPETLSKNITTQKELLNKVQEENGSLDESAKSQLMAYGGYEESDFSITASGYRLNDVSEVENKFKQYNTEDFLTAFKDFINNTDENQKQDKYDQLLNMSSIMGAENQNMVLDQNALDSIFTFDNLTESFVANKAELEAITELYDTYYESVSMAAEGDENLYLKNQQLKKELKNGTQQTKASATAMVQLGKEEQKAAEKFDNFSKVINDNIDALDENKKDTVEYKTALSQVGASMAEVFNQDFDEDFLEQHLQDIKDFAEGDEGAFNRLAESIRGNTIPALETQLSELDNTITSLDQIEGLRAILDGSEFDINGEADFSNVFAQLVAVYGSAEEAAAAIEALGGYQVTFEQYTDEEGNVNFTAKIADTFRQATTRNWNNYGGGSKSKSGGGGSTKEEKPKYWDNPYDELYNLIEQQNEALRTREKLERDYDRILKNRNRTTKELRENVLQELANLREQERIQNRILQGRERMIKELSTKGTYRDEEGNERSYVDWGVDKYARYDFDTGTIIIDWEAIDQIEDPEIGAALEAYISDLTDLSESYEETEDKLEDIRDDVAEIKERNKEQYLELEDRIYEALVNQEQAVIDEYSALADTIADSNSKILDGLRESIDMERQIRDNTKKEEEIADKEARLAYLQRDTSGANQQEILKLQKEIEEASESYSDELVDQAIAEIEKENQRAEEQRQQQIEIMQAQLDWYSENGMFWGQVYELIANAMDENGDIKADSELMKLLQEDENFKGLSYFGQENWVENMAETWKNAMEGKDNWEGKNEEEPNPSGGSVNQPGNPSGSEPGTEPKAAPEEHQLTDSVKRSVAGAIWNGLWGNGAERVRKLEEVFGKNNGIQALVDAYVGKNDSADVAAAYSYDAMKKIKWKAYAKGGIVDFTGPAWLDGTKSNPELILSAQDTENFIALRNALAQMLAQSKLGSGKSGGDNYFDIQINVDELANDYDVDQLAAKIKKQIYDDSTYRNVNAINYLR